MVVVVELWAELQRARFSPEEWSFCSGSIAWGEVGFFQVHSRGSALVYLR